MENYSLAAALVRSCVSVYRDLVMVVGRYSVIVAKWSNSSGILFFSTGWNAPFKPEKQKRILTKFINNFSGWNGL